MSRSGYIVCFSLLLSCMSFGGLNAIGQAVDHEAAVAIDRDQLERRQPDLKGALADRLQQPCADLLPDSLLLFPGPRQSLPHGAEVDPDRAPTRATTFGEVRLLDQNLVSEAPPARGVGG